MIAWPVGVWAAAAAAAAAVSCVPMVTFLEVAPTGRVELPSSDLLTVPSPPASYPSTEHCWPASHSGTPPSSAPSGMGEFSSPLISGPSRTGQTSPGDEQSMNFPSCGVASLRLAESLAPQNIAMSRASSGVASQWHITKAGASALIRSLQLRGSSCE
ncbi:hypothetical protein ACFQX6_47095 [Streptosporangium lutulentum]